MREELLATARDSGFVPVDLSLGVACDPEPDAADAWAAEGGEPGYPKSRGFAVLRTAAAAALRRRYGVSVPPDAVAACAGSKEFIGSAALFLRQERGGGRDTVLIPRLRYPTYGVGAALAGMRTVEVPTDDAFRMRLDLLPPSDVRRALCLWVNSPANPTGVVEPLAAVARWGREHGVIVLSDEAYTDLTWDGSPGTILSSGLDGVLAVHSMSKASHAPGLRVGFYAGDPRLVAPLVVRRRDAGLMAAAPAQAMAARLLGDDRRVAGQRARTLRRLTGLVDLLNGAGLRCARPEGAMFVWLRTPGGDGAAFARLAARTAGLVLAPGAQYGPAGHPYVRIAATEEQETVGPRIGLLATALGRAPAPPSPGDTPPGDTPPGPATAGATKPPRARNREGALP